MRTMIKQIPLVKQVYQQIKKAKYKRKEAEYKRKFETDCYSCFWGVFETFEQAKQAAPSTKTIGYDNADLAQEYQQMLEQNNWEGSGQTIRPHDYPALFWLKSVLSDECNRVFDFGGNVGVHYYAYSNYLNYSDSLEWTVCDLPEIVKAGKELAESRFEKKLFFTTNLSDISNHDILIASGSVQYIEDLAQLLSTHKKIKHLLINRLPLYEGKRFVTLQNGGRVFYPQYVFNKTEFIEGLRSLGYELVDIWQDTGNSCIIPFHPEQSIPFYYGMYLKLKL
ncbi:methyltransferase, TIGR04325 family [Cyanobacteria bacterium FACHB-502]|nr:methyltransferase, TIGR04325 family [Cyanobacteria bacterium FACHB-502]